MWRYSGYSENVLRPMRNSSCTHLVRILLAAKKHLKLLMLEMLIMLTRILKKATVLLVLVSSLLFTTVVFADDTIVAKVGNVPITIFELNRQLQKLIPLAGSYHSGVSQDKVAELQGQALDDLIEQAYMVQYAFDEEISVPKSDVDAMLDPIVERFDSMMHLLLH